MKTFIITTLQLLRFVCAQDDSDLVLVQLAGRHGAKVPDTIEASQVDFWPQYGLAGQFTSKGEQQMRLFGQFLRERYIVEEELLPQTFDQNLLYARTSQVNNRPMMSIQSALKTFYPGAPVPVYSAAPEQDNLLGAFSRQTGSGTCPSVTAEVPIYRFELTDFYDSSNYSQIIQQFRSVADFGDLTTSEFVRALSDSLESELIHGAPAHPFILENAELIFQEIGNQYWSADVLLYQEPLDPRGGAFQELARTWLGNIRNHISGDSSVSMYWYAAHGQVITGIKSFLGVLQPTDWQYIGGHIILELRRSRSTGQYFVRADQVYANWEDGSVTYSASPLLLNCPTPNQRDCPVENWMQYVMDRNPVGGCCLRGRAFSYFGCDDYLNPDVLNRPECVAYRTWCPAQSCGPGQILDLATMLCVVPAENERSLKEGRLKEKVGFWASEDAKKLRKN